MESDSCQWNIYIQGASSYCTVVCRMYLSFFHIMYGSNLWCS